MLRSSKIAIAIGVAVLGTWITSANAQAGWGHRHHDHGHHHHGHHHHHGWGHHHHHHGFYGSYAPSIFGSSFLGGSLGAWGWPSYGWGGRYTSLSIGIGLPGYTLDYPRRYPYIYPGSLSSYDYYFARPSVLSYPSVRSYYAAPYYSSYSLGYAAPYTSSYYASPYASSYYASSACCAPVTSCCDPCAGLPIDSAPATSTPSYVPDAVPAVPADPSPAAAGEGPSVHALPNWIPSSNLTRSGYTGQGRGVIAGSLLATTGRESAQSVSLAKPVMPEIATSLMPLSRSLLQAADAVFAAGDYPQAAAAYARLTTRYGNHDELAVRRFIALVASGDCEQAAVMYEAASLAEQSLLSSALPAGGLVELYGDTAAAREQHVDYLAAYALKHPDDGLALAMVGTWLELDGQSERAQLFMQRAAALAPADRLPTRSEHLVATDISQ